METIKENNINVEELVTALENGAVLVLPTDTVYGLVCDAKNEKAVEKIFEIKKRDKLKPLPVFVKDIKMAKEYAVLNAEQEDFLKSKWPGATTVVLEGRKGLSQLVYKDNTIALRQPNYKLILDIIELFKKPLAQTSANIAGLDATTDIKKVLEYFNNHEIVPDIIIDAGELPKNKPSAIIDLSTKDIKIIRN